MISALGSGSLPVLWPYLLACARGWSNNRPQAQVRLMLAMHFGSNRTCKNSHQTEMCSAEDKDNCVKLYLETIKVFTFPN